MKSLPAAFQAMSAFRQFVLWIAVPSSRPGKMDKITIDPKTGRAADAHSPTNHLSAHEAIALAPLWNAGVGFTFTPNDPFFFLDIDNCLTDSGWSDLAMKLCQDFNGCAVEISHSGKGLHIFGTGRPDGAYKTKNTGLGLEFYTESRFVALTGNGALGDSSHSGPVEEFCRQYIPVKGDEASGPDWTDGPVSEWSGPEDDDELIARALRSKSSASAFGGRATFQELWEVDPEALSRTYPATDREYDASSADAALMQHLAFWTGKDCERMDRLFRRSGLNRDKWEDRPDYRRMTILGATGRCSKVYQQGGGKTDQAEGGGANGDLLVGFQYLSVPQQIDHFKDCVYIRDTHNIFVPDGGMLKPEQFKATYGGHIFALDATGEKTTPDAWKAFTESQGYRFPKATRTCFRPELPTAMVVHEESLTLVNTYVPIETERKAGDPGRFLRHLEKLLPVPGDRTILLSYMAACVQNKGKKFFWTPLLQGCEGNGKSLVISVMANAIGWRYTHLPNAADLGNKFNDWLSGKLFAGVEEVCVADKREISEPLKRIITDSKIEIQGKGSNQVLGDNRANFIMCSNHRDAVRKSRTDRRFCIFYTPQQGPGDIARDGMSGRYFPDLYDWLRSGGYAVVNDYLHSFVIPDELNPAGACHRAPVNSSTQEVLSASSGIIEQEILEAAAQERIGFIGGWISSIMLDRLFDEKRMGARITWSKRNDILKDLGYHPHPGLPGGRVNNVLPIEGGRPRLFVTSDNPHFHLTNPKEIAAAYTKAQGVLG